MKRTPLQNDVVDSVDYPAISKLILGIFALYIITFWLQLGLRREFFAAIRFEFILGAILGGLALFQLLTNKQSVTTDGRGIIVWCVGFIMVLGFSVPFAANAEVAWNAYSNHILKDAVVTFLISQFVVSPLGVRVFLLASLVAFLKIGQEAFVGKLTGSMVWFSQGIPRLHGTQGTMFGHPNSLSGKTVMIIPFLWYLYPTLKSRLLVAAFILQIVFVINIVVFTGSRTGYMAVIFAGLVILLLSERRFRVFAYLALIALITILATPLEYKERFLSSFTGEEKEGRSSDARLELLKDSVYVFVENPGGVGLKNFALVQQSEGRRAQDTHNLYTQILAETGIQGFLFFMGFILTVLSKARSAIIRFRILLDSLQRLASDNEIRRPQINQDIEDARLMVAVSLAITAYILVRLVLGIFGHDLLEIYWWMAAGLVLSLLKVEAVMKQRISSYSNQSTSQN